MIVDVSQEERQLLMDLVESRIRELHPTIRRSRVSTCTEGLKHDLVTMEQLLERLQQARGDSASNVSRQGAEV